MTELVYQVSFTGAASNALLAAFDDCLLTLGAGTTTLRCHHDALQDVLGRLESFGLELLDIRLVAAEQA